MKARRIPEVIQSSAMDCGPAALAAVLKGFGRPVSYPRLRETCQTDVDGTSIDLLEALAMRFGLAAEQIMLPTDCLFLKASPSLPCIAVIVLPNGLTHFVVVWREWLGFVQIMDPARGRSWMRKDRFITTLYQHQIQVPAEDWQEYARSSEFLAALNERLQLIGFSAAEAAKLVEQQVTLPGWRGLADLDAALRMSGDLRARGAGVSTGDIHALVTTLLETPELIPGELRQVREASGAPDDLLLKGAVLVRFADAEYPPPEDPVVAQVATAPEQTILRRLFGLCRTLDGDRLIPFLSASAALIGLITFIEALVFRYLIGAQLPSELPSLGLIALVVILPLLAAVALEAGGESLSQDLGRRLDLHLRTRLLRKLPRMSDGYFASRLVSDLAERGHAVGQIRAIPELIRRALILMIRLTLVLLGLAWLATPQLGLIALAALLALIAPIVIFPVLAERDLRARTHLGALARFHLDSLRGSEAIWAHGASRSIELEQESLLLKWAQAVGEFQRPVLLFDVVQTLALVLIGIALVIPALSSELPEGTVLLLAYWSLFLPVLSRQLTDVLKQLPGLASVAQRVLELTDAPEEPVADDAPSSTGSVAPASVSSSGVSIEYAGLTIRRGEQCLLEDLRLHIAAGERVAVVGPSGSGKSTFLSTLLGWHSLDARDPALTLDGQPATATALATLRESTVVIDPDLYLWNRTLFDNVCYGLDDPGASALEQAISGSEVIDDLEKMPDGLATIAGENGSRLSGGEGQRLRIARGLVHDAPRLVLMDEPFIGMDSMQRVRMKKRILDRWPSSTMIFVSHNIRETLEFDRVLVFGAGRILEDGNPRVLGEDADSVFANILASEQRLHHHLTTSETWTRRRFENGKLLTL
ncbi:MAG: cysteine peptidase family C39 domain-containing protein [Pseudomonadales bacterium]|nr:ATP-binding cassette domain-containing protein [Pseudomonadales bacterium]